MPTDLLPTLAQFGTAGLIAWMWLTERRATAQREKQLTEAHDRLTHETTSLSALLHAIRENTRVLAQIEAAQRTLIAVLSHESPERKLRP